MTGDHASVRFAMLLAALAGSAEPAAAQARAHPGPWPAAAESTADHVRPALLASPGDTTRATRAVDVSDWHARRLAIHRTTAYAVPVLFAAQYVVGQQLYRGVASAAGPADWVRPAHRTGAALIGTAFVINATTGLWNLWAERREPEGRAVRLLHGASMLAAAGGFTYAGVRLADQAQFSADKRREHRQVATASMALTLISGTAMWWINR